jgi:hypothetical protein
MLTMADLPNTGPFAESTVPPSTFMFNALPTPSRADWRSIPTGSQVVLISWPDEPPTIAGLVWDADGAETYLSMTEDWPEEARAKDVFLFYISKSDDDDAIIRRAMDLPDDSTLSVLDSARPVYSEADVRDMITTALALKATPF